MYQTRLYQLVRDFAVTCPPWGEAIRYQTKPDERYDLTLASQRIYGNREEFMAVMAAAGLETVEDEMQERLLTLPTASALERMKRVARGS